MPHNEDLDQLRKLNGRLLIIVIAMVAFSLFATSVAIFVLLHRPQPKYFAATNDLKVIPINALESPVLSDKNVEDWAERTVLATYSLDFVHWRTMLTDLQSAYTPMAYNQLIQALRDSGIIGMLKSDEAGGRAIISTAPTGTPVLTRQYDANGHHVWVLSVPFIMQYQTSQGVQQPQHVMAEITVVSVPYTSNPAGIQIDSIIVGEDKNHAF